MGELDEDVLDLVCIAPNAVERWVALVQEHATSNAGVELFPDEVARVEADGSLHVVIEINRVPVVEMHCSAEEWCWSAGSRQ